MSFWSRSLLPAPGEGRDFYLATASGLLVGVLLGFGSYAGYLSYLNGWVPIQAVVLIILCTLAAGSVVRVYRDFRCPAHVRGYHSDVLNNVGWRWRYDENYEPVRIEPFCPRHGVRATPHVNAGTATTDVYCHRCNHVFASFTNVVDLEHEHALPEIEDRIRTGTWRTEADQRFPFSK